MSSTLLGGLAALGAVVACSSSEPPGSVDPPEERDDAATDAPPPKVDAGADATSLTCSPGALSGPPRFVPSRKWRQDACTPTQVAGYVKSCLESSTSVCATWAKQNPTCFACAETDETAPEWGPIVIFANGSYFEENFAGCVANALGDRSKDGCGAAQAQFEECRRDACRGCLPIVTQEDYDAFATCGRKRDLAKVCAEPLARIDVACAAHLDPKPDDPVWPCLGVGLGGAAYFEAYVSLFCTAAPPPDAGDASTD
ncbi:MAG: hypothetical protein JST00_01860 [Deltaproteobacteria bacterium]|nr:hypothetical protein [Deltaproteobacteria bacterium]